jgi:hypothetical protein
MSTSDDGHLIDCDPATKVWTLGTSGGGRRLTRGRRAFDAPLLIRLLEMENLRVDVDGVHALADRTQDLAGDLVTGSAPTELGASGWSSAAAVNTVHMAAMGTGDALAARTRITATKIAAAGARFAAHEASASDELTALENR